MTSIGRSLRWDDVVVVVVVVVVVDVVVVIVAVGVVAVDVDAAAIMNIIATTTPMHAIT